MTAGPCRSADWTAPQWASIRRAVERWNELAHEEVVRLEAIGGTRKMQHILPASLPEHYAGMHSPSMATIRIDVEQADDEFETVVVHELGHALGLEHVEAPGIMNGVVDGSVVDFTLADRVECERAGWCRAVQTR